MPLLNMYLSLLVFLDAIAKNITEKKQQPPSNQIYINIMAFGGYSAAALFANHPVASAMDKLDQSS